MKNSILITMETIDSCLAISTTDRKHGKSLRFFVRKDDILLVAAGLKNYLLDMDIGNFIRVSYYGKQHLDVELTWLRENTARDVTGYRQSFLLPKSAFYDAMDNGRAEVVVNPDARWTKSHIILEESAQRQIASLSPDERRAFGLCLSRSFSWGPEEIVHIKADFGKDFWFYCEFNERMEGGLILHRRKHRSGSTYPVYEVHT